MYTYTVSIALAVGDPRRPLSQADQDCLRQDDHDARPFPSPSLRDPVHRHRQPHSLVAIAQVRHEWRDLLADGFVNQIDEKGSSYQAVGYWFFILGPTLIATGRLAQAHLDATGTLPRSFCGIVTGTSLAAGVAMPANGIWAVGLLGMLGLTLTDPGTTGAAEPPTASSEVSRG